MARDTLEKDQATQAMASTPPKSEPRPTGETTKKLPRLHSDEDDDEGFGSLVQIVWLKTLQLKWRVLWV